MSEADAFKTYLRDLQKNLASEQATEHTHRPALKTLLEAIGGNVQAVNEPKRIECGAPDYIITRSNTPVGYVEAKDIGESLDSAYKSDQMHRYLDSLNNLILTDYLEFRWYIEGEHRETARLATLTRDGRIKKSSEGLEAVTALLQGFFAQEVPTIGRPKELAQRMAALARMIQDLIEETFEKEPEGGTLHIQLKAFQEELIPDLTPKQFADMYAQTITYGLFAARVRVPMGQGFTRRNAAWNLPKTNPFLRKLFNEIAGPDLDDRIAWLVDDLAYLLARADMSEVLRDFGKRARQEDPIVHFYETFLSAYDPKMKQKRGVYYTPEPVVSYIVRSIDHILKTRFDRPLGLADPKTLILDPAVGTATFLYFAIQQINETLIAKGQAGGWNDYVKNHLLPRIFGFELLMAPYAVAHMKLGLLLQETGYDFSGDQRLGIYLTNTLEEALFRTEVAAFARYIVEEANAAAEVKTEKPIMVVLGNPPYSVSSANKGEHIEKLMERYKAAVRSERNIQPLSDDYIKFIRFAHDRIERTGYGIVGMITNHAYLFSLIHRGMREELIRTFEEIYILNLHGNAILKETTPDGGADENVFDIRQGVTIALFTKRQATERQAKVKYADLWGRQEGKYGYLLENDVSTTDWQDLEPIAPHFFFTPKDFDLMSEYEQGWKVLDIFLMNSSGIKTHRDHFVIDFEENPLRSRIAAIRDDSLSNEEVSQRFRLRDTGSWELSKARLKLRALDDWEKLFSPCLYRPFDARIIYYSDAVIDRPRPQLMHHMLGDNLALIVGRAGHVVESETWGLLFCTTDLVDTNIYYRGGGVVFPLYRYHQKQKETPLKGGRSAVNLTLPKSKSEYNTRDHNLSPQFITTVKGKLDLDFLPDGRGDLQGTFGPEDIFHYMYAIFHSPTYRERYAEFLKIDFPRLPLTSDQALFRALAEKGEELVALHLMESPKLNSLVTAFPVPDSNEVERVRYAEPRSDEEGNQIPGRVYINKTQYFEGVEPEVWEFQIGGYQVLHKWLKDRKGRQLSFDDTWHYQKIVVALKETMRLMEEIDELIPKWPIE